MLPMVTSFGAKVLLDQELWKQVKSFSLCLRKPKVSRDPKRGCWRNWWLISREGAPTCWRTNEPGSKSSPPSSALATQKFSKRPRLHQCLAKTDRGRIPSRGPSRERQNRGPRSGQAKGEGGLALHPACPFHHAPHEIPGRRFHTPRRWEASTKVAWQGERQHRLDSQDSRASPGKGGGSRQKGLCGRGA